MTRDRDHFLTDIVYSGGKISELHYACNELYHAGHENNQEGVAMMAMALLDTRIEEHLVTLYTLLNGYFGGWEAFKLTQDKLKHGSSNTELPEPSELPEIYPSSSEPEVSANTVERTELLEEK